MKIAPSSAERIVRSVRDEVESQLNRCGLLFRVFGRFKSPDSIADKMSRKKHYSLGGKLIQDIIGIRVAAYFFDDLPIIREQLAARFGHPIDEVRDEPGHTTFQPIRWNLVFRLPESVSGEVKSHLAGQPIDATFETQLRTVLAEGWHEVEHDLRYKRPSDWVNEDDMSRLFNGLLASLENADWTMAQLFQRLAYQKYRDKQWEAMFTSLYRLRVHGTLDQRIVTALDVDQKTAKKIFRTDRARLIRTLASLDQFPLTLNNVVFVANRTSAMNRPILDAEPSMISRLLDASLSEYDRTMNPMWDTSRD
jgi:ppGpp synthetase/RelA/SpoT-type nucleotidyltranferase